MLTKHVKSAVLLFAAITALLILSAGAGAQERAPIYQAITIKSAITPPVASYILKSINDAVKDGADGLIILLDTPGGLDLAMRDIVKGILSAPIPVIVYVHPPGGRSASAGMIITIAAHVAAMAPGTNIGAAHPVAIGAGGKMDKTMADKVVNDAVAYVRGIAQKMGRNQDWAEKAVRKSISAPAEEALRLKVIDYVATDVNDLLRQMHQREVTLPSGKKTLNAKGAVVTEKTMGFRDKVLTAITDPNIAYILLLIGLAGLYFEFSNPGAIVPGVVGGISLLLALFALQALAVNYVGIILILFAIVLFVAEIKVVSHGILTIGGVISLLLGSLMLFDTPDPSIKVSFEVLIPAVVITTLFFVVMITMGLKAQTRKNETGREAMIGAEGETLTEVFKDGRILFRGEYWQAYSDTLIEKGKKVRIVEVNRMKLKVQEEK
ncbi:MAG: nodulation protein NfeD [Smithellaceae bacterium]|nr:nodulation protein NfeD [Smithellaceae bacterium]